ncbi:MAG: hypothetical protein KF900_09370 [Bacteroidetes bacterium]|nr:hypothetical protein [Bacteroidota bacterium]
MKSKLKKNGMLVIFTLYLILIAASALWHSFREKHSPPPQDTTYLHKWRNEKQFFLKQHEAKISALQSTNDSLKKVTNTKKKSLAVSRAKTKFFGIRLKQSLKRYDSLPIIADTIIPITENYMAAQLVQDSTCSEVIHALERLVANRDSSVYLYRQNENIFRDLQKEQQERERHLTEQLNIAYKIQKKKNRQNKILASGLLFVSGVASTLIVKQAIQ